MAIETTTTTSAGNPTGQPHLVDGDVHNNPGQALLPYLSPRWRRYQELVGLRQTHTGLIRVPQRPNASRLDATPPEGGEAGSSPSFAREQLLDRYGIDVAIINNLDGRSSGNLPVQFELDRARAINDYNLDQWLGSDSRWRASIVIAADHPQASVEEIRRCVALSDRFVQVIVNPLTERLLGNPKYWPIYEAAADLGLPISVHPMLSKYHTFSPVGEINYYFELRSLSATEPGAIVPSLIFEGVFDRWPSLDVVLTECQWEWAAPMLWRLDATWRVLREEVGHLQRPPSEYLLERFWFTTQPSIETEKPEQVREVYAQLTSAGLLGHMMYASDYPHWDMDEPIQGVPRTLPDDARADIFWRTADRVYRLGLGAAADR